MTVGQIAALLRADTAAARKIANTLRLTSFGQSKCCSGAMHREPGRTPRSLTGAGLHPGALKRDVQLLALRVEQRELVKRPPPSSAAPLDLVVTARRASHLRPLALRHTRAAPEASARRYGPLRWRPRCRHAAATAE